MYSWGPYVQRELELAGEGYSLMSTMHSETVDGVIEQLTEECDVPASNVGHLALVVPMFVGMNAGRRVRRVSEVAVLEPLGGAYDRHSIARWDAASDTYDVLTTPAQMNALARRFGMEDEDLIQALGEARTAHRGAAARRRDGDRRRAGARVRGAGYDTVLIEAWLRRFAIVADLQPGAGMCHMHGA